MEEHVAALAEDPPRAGSRRAHRGARGLPAAARRPARARACAPRRRRCSALLVEATARRYYRVRASRTSAARVDGHDLLLAEYPLEGRRRHLAAASSTWTTSARWRAAFAEHAATLPDGDLAVLDLYA